MAAGYTWDELEDRVIEALGEYDNQAVAGDTSRSLNAATVQKRLEEKYDELILDAARLNPGRFAATATLAYTADSESVALSGASATVRWRPIIRLEDTTDSSYKEEVPPMTVEEFMHWRDRDFRASPILRRDHTYRYYLEGPNIFLAPKPASARTLTFTYVQAGESFDGANPPTLLPPEYHHLIALEAAVSFMKQYGPPTYVEQERQDLKRRFKRWASSRDEWGPRYVHERY